MTTTSRRSLLRAAVAAPLAGLVGPVLSACGGGGETSFTLSVGDRMVFDVTEMRVEAGAEITVTVVHGGSMPVTSMGHNFVLLASGVDVAAFGAAAAAASESGYIPADRASDILAHTNMVGGGESDSVTFRAPSAGSYTYICSFPGHYTMMQGTLISS